MKTRFTGMMVMFLIASMIGMTTMVAKAEARAGSSRSSGSRGSRSYAPPRAPQQAVPNQSQRQYTPPPQVPQQAPGGGFLRSMAGGIAGGLLGGMLFRSLGFGGGYGSGGGIGLFEIILLGGIAYLIYRMVKKRREEAAPQRSEYTPVDTASYQQPAQPYALPQGDVDTGLTHIRQMDPYFDEQRFNDGMMDLFFKIQGAWMNRDLGPVAALLTPQMRQVFQADIDRLLRERRTNRLENIAVRNVEIVEVWQESGQDYITTLIYANLLDYTTDDASGQVVEGSKTEPVKFEEYWTVTRPVGNNPWQLSAIDQK
ncbi:Tim44 domain-containing protein [Geobacter sp. SVR]|uniref:Tim44 domain-containing protein n=1 Tax=Geobacter sp. SVR TaxID=2495594 RepID=UPI00143EF5D9|nr:Tim44 domain-containing protein [Geobacter sp. SVR]BCS55511.1 transporter [Geobacter sp. SVR]GCF83514.1 transporter [Geobacter sp. SVR]